MKRPYCTVEVPGGNVIRHDMATAQILEGNLVVAECEEDAGKISIKKGGQKWVYGPRWWLVVFQSAEERADA